MIREKFAILNDVHVGSRNANPYIQAAQARFFEKFFDYLSHNDIKTIVILGDLFDKRKIIDFKSLDFARKAFFDVAKKAKKDVVILLGNHDVYYKSTNELSSPELLLKDYENVQIVSKPEERIIEGIHCAMVPWVTEDNYDECVALIKSSRCPVMLGHYELVGFEMIPGVESKAGFEVSDFDKYDIVLSGHYHHKSHRKNVHQLGCQYEMDWGDYGMEKGFHVYHKTGNLEFIKNTDPLHVRLTYEGKPIKVLPDVKDKFVKIVVESYEKKAAFDEMVETLRNAGPADLRIIDNVSVEDAVDEFTTTEGLSMHDVFKTAVDALEAVSETGKKNIQDHINEIYLEALSEQT